MIPGIEFVRVKKSHRDRARTDSGSYWLIGQIKISGKGWQERVNGKIARASLKKSESSSSLDQALSDFMRQHVVRVVANDWGASMILGVLAHEGKAPRRVLRELSLRFKAGDTLVICPTIKRGEQLEDVPVRVYGLVPA